MELTLTLLQRAIEERETLDVAEDIEIRTSTNFN